MNVALIVLTCAGVAEAQVSPAPGPSPVRPVPNGPGVLRYGLCTDWHAPRCTRPVWRTTRWIDDNAGWHVSTVGAEGGRARKRLRESPDWNLWATAGRHAAGDGGIGPGFEWEAYIGNEWTGGVELEFTRSGPRLILALSYFPYEGHVRRYGWSVLAGEAVTSRRWHFDEDSLRELCTWLYVLARLELESVLNRFGFSARE